MLEVLVGVVMIHDVRLKILEQMLGVLELMFFGFVHFRSFYLNFGGLDPKNRPFVAVIVGTLVDWTPSTKKRFLILLHHSTLVIS